MPLSTRKDEVNAELVTIRDQLDGDEKSFLRFCMPEGLSGALLIGA